MATSLAGAWQRLRLLAPTVGILAMLVAPSVTSANNDPHRSFLPSPPFDIPAEWCGFPIHVDAAVDREYGKVSTLLDGTIVETITGSYVVTLTNSDTSKSVTVNAGGPATFTVLPDGSVSADLTGRSILYAPNLTMYEYPNVVAISGPVHVTETPPSPAFTSFSGHPKVLLDVCAALS